MDKWPTRGVATLLGFIWFNSEKICKTKKKVSRNDSGKKLLNNDQNKLKLKLNCQEELEVKESEDSVTTFEINFVDEECFAFLLYDDDDMYAEEVEEDEVEEG